MHIIHDYVNPYPMIRCLNNESLFFTPLSEFILSGISCIFPFFIPVHITIFVVLIKLGYIGYFLERIMRDQKISRPNDKIGSHVLQYVFSNNNCFEDLKQKLITVNYCYLCEKLKINYKAKQYIATMHNSGNINLIKLQNIRHFKMPITKLKTNVVIYVAMNLFSAVETLYVLQCGILNLLQMESMMDIVYDIRTIMCFLYILFKIQLLRHGINMFWSCFLIYHILPETISNYFPIYLPGYERNGYLTEVKILWDIMYFHQQQLGAMLDAGVCNDIAITIHQYLVHQLPLDPTREELITLISGYVSECDDQMKRHFTNI